MFIYPLLSEKIKILKGVDMDIKQLIGSRIKSIRTKKQLTQENLAERMNINPKYLSSIERGKENPTLNTMILMAEALEVDISEIFKFTQIEDFKLRKPLLTKLLEEADSEQLKVAYKVLSVIIKES